MHYYRQQPQEWLAPRGGGVRGKMGGIPNGNICLEDEAGGQAGVRSQQLVPIGRVGGQQIEGTVVVALCCLVHRSCRWPSMARALQNPRIYLAQQNSLSLAISMFAWHTGNSFSFLRNGYL